MTTPAQIELLARALYGSSGQFFPWDQLSDEAHNMFRGESTALLAQLGPLDPMGAVAMREYVDEILTDEYESCDGNVRAQSAIEAAVDAIRTIPLPAHADHLAAALALPEIARLVEAAQKAWDDACANHDKPPPVKYMAPYGGLVALHEALAALTPTTIGETKGDA